MFNFARKLTTLFNRQSETLAFRIPILCYHSWTTHGPSYHENDHVALEQDLKTLAARGYQIIPLTTLVRLLRGDKVGKALSEKRLVAITFDDGMMYDYEDHDSESLGKVLSFHTLMKQSEQFMPQVTDGPRAVSFVVASATFRDVLGGGDLQQFHANWWESCAAQGIVGIANHSWDHVHEFLETVKQQENLKGSFHAITTFEDAETQVAEANAFIAQKSGGRALPFFSYPYGHASTYVRDQYLPEHGARVGISAAFSTGGLPVTQQSSLWEIPRYVCGEHWQTPEQFETVLNAIEAAEAP